MMQELRRLWTSPVTWLLALGPITLNGALALFQRRYGPEHYWSFVGQFWDKLGLAAVAALVLTICLSLMAYDKSCRTEALMLTTRLGRKHLFLRRLLACALCPFLLVLLLSAGNLLCGIVRRAFHSVRLGRSLSGSHPSGRSGWGSPLPVRLRAVRTLSLPSCRLFAGGCGAGVQHPGPRPEGRTAGPVYHG